MLIKVKVFSGSKIETVEKKLDDSYIIRVKTKAERGEANRRIIEILANYFHLPPGKIRLIKGGKKPNKVFEIQKIG